MTAATSSFGPADDNDGDTSIKKAVTISKILIMSFPFETAASAIYRFIIVLLSTVRFSGAYAPKVYFVPAVFRVNASGISLLKATIASNPVQCVGTMWSGFIALMSATVLWMRSGLALIRWNPPM